MSKVAVLEHKGRRYYRALIQLAPLVIGRRTYISRGRISVRQGAR